MFLIKEQQFLWIDRPVNNSQSIYKKKLGIGNPISKNTNAIRREEETVIFVAY